MNEYPADTGKGSQDAFPNARPSDLTVSYATRIVAAARFLSLATSPGHVLLACAVQAVQPLFFDQPKQQLERSMHPKNLV